MFLVQELPYFLGIADLVLARYWLSLAVLK